MTHTADQLARLADTITELANLDPQFWQARNAYRRGGYPAKSIADGPGSSDLHSPALLHDTVDRNLDRDTKAYLAAINDAVRTLEQQHRTIASWVIAAPAIGQADPVPCGRHTCTNTVHNVGNDRLRRSPIDKIAICPRCYQADYRTVTKTQTGHP